MDRIAPNPDDVNYRYGFNGKEMDHEVKGATSSLDYGMRVYDPRVGRLLSVDPLAENYAWYTPYQFAGNKPIRYLDADGMEEALPKPQLSIPQLKNPSESTCAGCAQRSYSIQIFQATQDKANLKKEFEAWNSNPFLEECHLRILHYLKQLEKFPQLEKHSFLQLRPLQRTMVMY